MATSGIVWIKPPSDIARTLDQRTSGMETALNALAQNHASRGEALAKRTSAYQDQTGNLRAGTFGRAEGTDIMIGAAAEYAIYVELGTSRMSARPFIEPAARETAPAYFEDAAEVVRRLLGGGS